MASELFTTVNQGSCFLAYIITSKVIGIGAADISWGDVKMIKPGKRSAKSSDVSEKQSIFYTPACI